MVFFLSDSVWFNTKCDCVDSTLTLHTISGLGFQAFVAVHVFHIFQHTVKIPSELLLHVN